MREAPQRGAGNCAINHEHPAPAPQTQGIELVGDYLSAFDLYPRPHCNPHPNNRSSSAWNP